MTSYRYTTGVTFPADAVELEDGEDDDGGDDDGDWVTSSFVGQQEPRVRPVPTGSRRLAVNFISKTGS